MDDIRLRCGCLIRYEPKHDDRCKCEECGIQQGGGEWYMVEPCGEHMEWH